MVNKRIGKLFIISGPSGVGKGTLISSFIKQQGDLVKLSISATTRKPRKGEIDGINYFFLSEQKFKQMIEYGEFLEYARYSDNFYGTRKNYVNKVLLNNIDLIVEVDTQGAFQIKEKMPQSVSIFIFPPSFDELKKRLVTRNTETQDVIEKRLEFVKMEFENAKKFDYKIVNDNLELALRELTFIFEKERLKGNEKET